MKLSVVYVTNRPGGMDILLDNLNRQTFKDFELILADELYKERKTEVELLFAKYPVKHFKPREKQEGDVWNLNKAYNDALDKVEGELVVFLQDYIWIPANGLERFWDIYELYPNAPVTGCGHKAQKSNGIKRPAGISEVDDRVNGEKRLVESDWTYYELNWASCPTKYLVRFDETMDTYYGGENQVFALQVFKKCGIIYLDRLNECVGHPQDIFGRPEDWEEKHANKGFLNKKIQEICQI